MDYPIKEVELVELAGITRPNFQKMREKILTPYDDFMKIKNVLHLSEDAALRVLTALEVSSPTNLLKRLLGVIPDKEATPPPPEKNAQIHSTGSGQAVAVIVKLPVNTRIIMAVLESTEQIRVKVHNSRMFVLHQRIPVKKTPNPCWELDAKQPRRKGRIPGFEG